MDDVVVVVVVEEEEAVFIQWTTDKCCRGEADRGISTDCYSSSSSYREAFLQ